MRSKWGVNALSFRDTEGQRKSHLVCFCLSSQKVTVLGSEGGTDLPYMHHLAHCAPKNHGLRAFAEQKSRPL